MGIKFKNPFRKKNQNKGKVKEQTTEYYDRTQIDETGANWRLIIGQRSNGKSYSICKTIIEDYINEGKRAVYVRRYAEEIMPKNIQTLFDPHIPLIKELTGGEWNAIFYRANEFRLAYYDDEEGKITRKDETPFCTTRAVNTWETTKGADLGHISLICFDEFMTRQSYLRDEFICFANLCSSIIRDRKDCVIYMLANTVNQYCPYWEEFGIEDITQMEQGEIRVYTYPNSKMKLAIEYCSTSTTTKEVNDSFFAFENAQLAVIKSGAWEMAQYPRPPYKIFEEDIKYRFYLEFGGELLCGEVVNPVVKKHNTDLFIFFHRQTKDIEIDNLTAFYTTKPTTSICHVRYLKDQPTDVHRLITSLIMKNHMYFATNEVGEIVRNFLMDQGIRNLL